MTPGRLLAGAAAAVLATGCGGPSKADFIRTVDPVCAGANAQLKAAGPLPPIDVRYATGDQMPAAGAYLDKVVPVFSREAADLHGLGEPSEDATAVSDTLMFLDRFVARLEQADRAAHRSDAGDFTISLVRAIGDGYQAQGVASQFGFAVCGRLPQL